MKTSNFYRLNSRLQELLRNKGFKSLREIQEKSIEFIFKDENLLIIAPTASGKTEAALLPIISNILDQEETEPSLKCIYVAPLKALLNDIELRLIALKDYEDSQPYVLKWHGDVSRSKKLKALIQYPDILLITPESLEVLFISPHIEHIKLFKDVKYLIVDEVHNFSSNSRGAQLNSLFSRIENISKHSIQKIGLSATIGNPDIILNWMTSNSNLKSSIITSEETKKEAKVRFVHNDDNDEYYSKTLSEICKEGKTIIFNNSRSFAEKISRDLEKLDIECSVHHGSLSKFIREEAEDKIKTESNGVISATSTLELGIDIGDLDKVIQIQDFSSVNSFLQRLGRTGRRSGNIPFIISMTDNSFDFLINLSIVSLGLYDKFSEPITPSKLRYDILMQQLLSHAVSEYGIEKIEFWNIVQDTYCFKNITAIEFDYLINYWNDNNIIRIENNSILLGDVGEKFFGRRNYLELFSVFEGNDQYEVIYNKYSIGVLDSWFVKSKTGQFFFRLAGKKWQVEEIDDKRKLIYVSLTSQGITPFWMGGSFSNINFIIAQRAREIITNEFDCKIFNLGANEKDVLDNIRNGKDFFRVVSDEILIAQTNDGISLYTYAGTMINKILSIIIKYYTNKSIEGIDCISLDYNRKSFQSLELITLFRKLKTELSFDILSDIVVNSVEIWNYSKFAEYIPEELSRKYIISEYYNIEEFIKYFQKVKFTTNISPF